MAFEPGAQPRQLAEADEALLKIILASTRLSSVPLVPEIEIHQASEPIGLWEGTELATGRTGLDPPFWAFAWAGGRALARYLLDHPQVAAGRRVIDLASGSGLVAIAAAKAGAATVTAYDIDPLAAAAVLVNARANEVTVESVCADAFGDDGPVPADGDLVLVADAFYERDLAASVTVFLQGARERGAATLAGDFGRTYLPRERLVALAAYDVPGLLVLEGSEIKRTTVWTNSSRQGDQKGGLAP